MGRHNQRRPWQGVVAGVLAAMSFTLSAHPGPGTGAWQVDDPARHGFDRDILDRVSAEVGAIAGRQGLVIVHAGRIVHEDYWSNPYHQATAEWRNVSFSSAKSWGSALVGVAITHRLITLDTMVAEFHPTAESGLHADTRVRDILTMSSGGTLTIKPSTRRPRVKTENPQPGRGIDYLRVLKPDAGAPRGYGTTLPPGRKFYYDGEPVDHLADVIAAASGMSSRAFSERYLLAPLGVAQFNYQAEGIDSHDNIRLAGSIELSVRDLARLGQLWLNGGRWNGRQLIDADYVAASIQPSNLNPNYGFLWWLNTGEGRIRGAPETLYYASGAFGQIVFVLPDDDLVIATMGYQEERVPDVAQQIWNALAPLLRQRTR